MTYPQNVKIIVQCETVMKIRIHKWGNNHRSFCVMCISVCNGTQGHRKDCLNLFNVSKYVNHMSTMLSWKP